MWEGKCRHGNSIPSWTWMKISLFSAEVIMQTTFQKLNLKEHAHILVLNVPKSFEPELATLRGITIRRSLRAGFEFAFVLAFVTRQDEVDGLAVEIAKATTRDVVLWFAYPKGSSKRLKSEINRDRGWQILGDLGFEPVRNIAIDDDWTALRFRRVEFIRTLKRTPHHRLSAQGKAHPPSD